MKENITVPGILDGDAPTVALASTGIGKAQGSTSFYHFTRLLRLRCVLDRLTCLTSPANTFLRYNAFALRNRELGTSYPALTQLRALHYRKEILVLDPRLLDWLLLEDSMTKRFEQQGKTASVAMIREGFVEQNEIPEELPLLPKEPRYWLREILLCADGEPWFASRTVALVSTLSGSELAL